MGKNKLFNGMLSGLFGEKAKAKKIIKKIKGLKKDYVTLDKKLLSGTISQKELKKYYNVKEDIKKMSKKFAIKDGKILMNEPVPQVPVQPVQQTPIQVPVQPVQQTFIPEGMPGPQTPEIPNKEMADRIAFIARQEAITREEERVYNLQTQQAQLNEQQVQERIKQRQLYAQEQAHIHQQEQPQVQGKLFEAEIYIVESPSLKIRLLANQIDGFEHAIGEAMTNGTLFPYVNAKINGSKIIMYKITPLE